MLAYNRAITCVWILEQIPVESLESVEWLSRNRGSLGKCVVWHGHVKDQGLGLRGIWQSFLLSQPPIMDMVRFGVVVCLLLLPQRAYGPAFLYLCLSSSFPHRSKSGLRDLEGQDALRSRAGIFPQGLCEFLNMWQLSYMRWKTMATYWLFYLH